MYCGVVFMSGMLASVYTLSRVRFVDQLQFFCRGEGRGQQDHLSFLYSVSHCDWDWGGGIENNTQRTIDSLKVQSSLHADTINNAFAYRQPII